MPVVSVNEVVTFLGRTTRRIDEGDLPPGYAAFAVAYHAFTLEMIAKLTSGVFTDPIRMSDFVVRFCARYEEALDDRRSCRRPWRIAFEAAESSSRPVVRNLLLGASAHMSFDLCAVIADMLETHRASELEHDVLAINRVIAPGIAQVQRALVARSPHTVVLAAVGLGIDDYVVWRTFASWRLGAWHDAVRVADGDCLLTDVEERAVARAAALRRLPV